MPTAASVLIAASAAVILLLGSVHMTYTFIGRKLHPLDDGLRMTLMEAPLIMTRRTTFWRAWVGFNASHSQGAMLFGLVYGYLALWAPQVLFGSVFLRGVGLAMLVGYLWLAQRYWFKVPLRGIALALILYAAGLATHSLFP